MSNIPRLLDPRATLDRNFITSFVTTTPNVPITLTSEMGNRLKQNTFSILMLNRQVGGSSPPLAPTTYASTLANLTDFEVGRSVAK